MILTPKEIPINTSLFCSHYRRLPIGLLSSTNHRPPSLTVSSPRSVHRPRPIDFESGYSVEYSSIP
ncbi:hypothetical protein CsSME_00026150 [Camellia sinensis var. sinensis]